MSKKHVGDLRPSRKGSGDDGYTIPAIPTTYRGRKYRSRLEARWAAFFDLLGWKHEYEPVDLGGWSPDFALEFGKCDRPIYVEVKPWTPICRRTAQKISECLSRKKLQDACDIILTTGAPHPTSRGLFIGWSLEYFSRLPAFVPAPAYVGQIQRNDFLSTQRDLLSVVEFPQIAAACWRGLIWRDANRCRVRQISADPGALTSWVGAANAVQWRAPA